MMPACHDQPRGWSLRVLKAAGAYFTLVFGAGFILGIIRTIWLAPRFGARMAELMEMPIMLIVIIAAAQWQVGKVKAPVTSFSLLVVGGIALGLILAVEFSLVLQLRGISIAEYFATRDPVAGTAYYVMLAVFAIMPLAVARRQSGILKHRRSP